MCRLRLLALAFVVPVLVSGCGVWGPGGGAALGTGSPAPVEFRFKPTTEPQRAVFLTQQAPMVGGPAAGAVYLAPNENSRVRIGDRQVLISHAAHRDLLARLPRPAPKDALFFLVEAQVRVEGDSGKITTNPPMSQSFLGVVFEDIIRVEWYVPPKAVP